MRSPSLHSSHCNCSRDCVYQHLDEHHLICRDELPRQRPGSFVTDVQLIPHWWLKTSSATCLQRNTSDVGQQTGQSLDSLLKLWRDFALLALAIWSVAATFIAVLYIVLARAWRQRILAETDVSDMAQRLTLATEAAAIGILYCDVKNARWFASPILLHHAWRRARRRYACPRTVD